MKGSTIASMAGITAMATAALLIDQTAQVNAQPTNTTPRQPSTTPGQPSTTTPGQPSTTTPGQPTTRPGITNRDTMRQPGDSTTRYRTHATSIQTAYDRLTSMNERLEQQLTEAKRLSGEQKVDALAEVLDGVLQEHTIMTDTMARLHGYNIRHYLEDKGQSEDLETWRRQYPWLGDDHFSGNRDGLNRDHNRDNDINKDMDKDDDKKDTTIPPRNPR
jgi:hypothetical protein